HAEAAQSRTAYVVEEITTFNAGLSDEARAEKYTKMKASPFTFFRGSNHLYWKDYGDSPQLSTYGGGADTRTWLGGDMHVNNTGSFDDDQGDIVFGLNDFDEAIIGDYQLDVWRMAISLVLAARENGLFTRTEQESFVDAFSESYLDTLDAYVGNSAETTRKFLASNTYGRLNDFLVDVEASNSRVELLDKWTVKLSGVRRLDTSSHPDLAPVSSSVESDLRNQMGAYRGTLSGGSLPSSYFTVKSVAQRLHAGIGSVGVSRYYVHIEGPSSSQDDDRLLDVKDQRTPSAWPYLSLSAVSQTNATCGGNMAYRTVLAYKALGYRVDDHLGWMTLADGLTYSVREVSPWKDTFPTPELDTLTRFTRLAEQWGQVLATHHARADKDWDASVFPYSLDGEVRSRTNGDHAGFRAQVRALATDSADQVEYDYASFLTHF
ncbi:MAG TPA: DUF2252 family protein, partial [Myxococcaceae bacterium]|nr:DUF2252 family protein [Myxococcaceae bacterium]